MTHTDLNDLVSCRGCGTVHELSLTKKKKKEYSEVWICNSCKKENWLTT